MNTIFNKLKPHRKYIRKPMCANLDGVCDYQTCRCGYANILDKRAKNSIRKGIDEDLPLREKVIKRRREIELNKLDEENCSECQFEEDHHSQSCSKYKEYDFMGEYGKRKTQIKKYKRNIYWVFWGFIGLVVLYPILIAIIDLFYRGP